MDNIINTFKKFDHPVLIFVLTSPHDDDYNYFVVSDVDKDHLEISLFNKENMIVRNVIKKNDYVALYEKLIIEIAVQNEELENIAYHEKIKIMKREKYFYKGHLINKLRAFAGFKKCDIIYDNREPVFHISFEACSYYARISFDSKVVMNIKCLHSELSRALYMKELLRDTIVKHMYTDCHYITKKIERIKKIINNKFYDLFHYGTIDELFDKICMLRSSKFYICNEIMIFKIYPDNNHNELIILS